MSSHRGRVPGPPRWLLALEAALLALILALALGAAGGPPPFDRAAWGGWAVEGCRDTRTRVLLRDAEPRTVRWRDGRGPGRDSSEECVVASGRWIDPYTGAVVTDPARLDVDHLVPLANAHASGGWRWSPARKRAYANDLAYRGHLRAVLASANREKGNRGPDRWRPPRREAWCSYALDWSAVKFTWALHAPEAERLAVREMLRTCGDAGAKTVPD